MIIIIKKRIQIILGCIIIAVIACSFPIANQKQSDTIETTATPVSGKTIVIDAGHGVPDERSTE